MRRKESSRVASLSETLMDLSPSPTSLIFESSKMPPIRPVLLQSSHPIQTRSHELLSSLFAKQVVFVYTRRVKMLTVHFPLGKLGILTTSTPLSPLPMQCLQPLSSNSTSSVQEPSASLLPSQSRTTGKHPLRKRRNSSSSA